MTTFRNCLLALVVCALALVPLASAQPEQLIELQAAGARVFAASRAEVLAPNAGSAAATIAAFLRSRNVPQTAVDSLVLETGSAAPGAAVNHYRFKQSVQGLDVYGTYVKAAFNGSGDLVHLIELLGTPPARLVPAVVTPAAALAAVARQLYPFEAFTFTEGARTGNTIEFSSGDDYFFKNPAVTRVAAPIAGAAMQEAFLVETWTKDSNQLHHSLVSASGRILRSELRTANERYNVYPDNPNVDVQTLMNGPGSGNAESPQGWIGTSGITKGVQYQFRMSGNNVDAYLDRDNNNSPDNAGATRAGPDFGTTVNKNLDPTDPQNQEAAIAHLFYFNNVIHDKLYRHGFIESAGNFQETNFIAGGIGNDSVMAEAQDGGGTNNANFATPTDGSRPRMQMYIWDQSNPRRDGDLDSDIVYHEYGHGLTWRMIGSMSGCMSGAIGEGASDSLSILMNNNDVVGEYSYNRTGGIRRYPYTNYPLTYGDFTNEGVHAGGELFGAIMWRAKEKFTAENLNQDDLWQALVSGMNFIPAGPKYENMRDGIVQAAGGTRTQKGCLIYKAFAEYRGWAGRFGIVLRLGRLLQSPDDLE
jgi:extracellular elastinolytic metalloproteinase